MSVLQWTPDGLPYYAPGGPESTADVPPQPIAPDQQPAAAPQTITLQPVDHKPEFETKVSLTPVDHVPQFTDADISSLGSAGAPFGTQSPAEQGATPPGIAKLGEAVARGTEDWIATPRHEMERQPIAPAVPGQWSDEDEARQQINAGQQIQTQSGFGWNTSLNMLGGGTAFAPRSASTLTTFGGRNAKTANLDKLADAIQSDFTLGSPDGLLKIAQMKGGSIPDAVALVRNTIWHNTGWFKAKDGEWRFEIPDRDAPLHATGPNKDQPYPIDTPHTTTLGQVLDHPEMHAAYPEWGSTPVEFRDLGDPTRIGATSGWVEPSGKIVIGTMPKTPKNLDEARRSLLHESMHVVQKKYESKFSRGGNPNDKRLNPVAAKMVEDAVPRATAIKKDIEDEIRQHVVGGGTTNDWIDKNPAQWKRYSDAVDVVDKNDRAISAARGDIYHRMSGEVEARNVEHRADLTAPQRAMNPPEVTEDVPRNKQFKTPPASQMPDVPDNWEMKTAPGDELHQLAQ